MNADSPAVVTCVGLTKVYQTGVVALNDLTLTIEPGMSFGLMGENGAGKSTLVRLLMGFIFPTRGQLSVLGESEVRRAHARIGYLHERPYVELRFTARSYLTYLAQLSGLWDAANRQRVQSVLEQVDLNAAAGERLASYSKGMLQRLSIAQTLLTEIRARKPLRFIRGMKRRSLFGEVRGSQLGCLTGGIWPAMIGIDVLHREKREADGRKATQTENGNVPARIALAG
jgi:ABC-type transport system involved in cytochrome c biogenesis ATPase subunit